MPTDTERLDWLDSSKRDLLFWERLNGELGWTTTNQPGVVSGDLHSTVRAALDAAMEATRGE